MEQLNNTPPAPLTQVAEYSTTAAALGELRQKYESVIFQVATPAGMKEAISARAELRDLRIGLEKMRKKIKSPALLRCQLIDTEAKQITAQLTALEDPIDSQIQVEQARKAAEKAERERKESERVAAIRSKIDGIRGLPAASFRDSASDIAATLADLEKFTIGADEFAEFAQEAETVRGAAISELRDLLAKAQAAEAEAACLAAERAELERLRTEAAERERIAAEELAEADRQATAARKAEEDRLRAEREAFEAERRAFAEQQAAIARVASDAEAQRVIEAAPVVINTPTETEVISADLAGSDDQSTIVAMVNIERDDPIQGRIDCLRLAVHDLMTLGYSPDCILSLVNDAMTTSMAA